MSRKRQLKKERARLGALEEQLERLARKGDDDGFLQLARGRTGELSPAAAELHGQVADRALERALAEADLPRLERLLSWLGRGARSRRLGPLAEAVAHLAAGRLAEARAGLAAVDPATGGAPPRLLSALLALSSPGGGLDGMQAIGRFSRSLEAVRGAGFRPPPALIEELREAVGALATSLPAEPALGRLLQAAREHLRLLTDLAGLEEELLGRAGSAGLIPFFLERLRGGLARPLLAVFRDGSPSAALLHPLRYAVRLRWRTLLELVAAQGDVAAQAHLWEDFPALFAVDLEPAGGPERLKNWVSLHELRETRTWRPLARLLGALADAERAPERMALLWSLELWAWERAAADWKDEDEENGVRGGALDPAPHAALVRLGRMAGEISGRLPSGQRPGVARILRERLFDLCEGLHFCDHSTDAAGTLLKFLPDDAGLLTVALTGAVCSNDVRAQSLFASRIAARGRAGREDREVLLRLVEHIALEDSKDVVRILPSLRLLVGEETWPEVLAIVLRSLTNLACALLQRGGRAALQPIFGDLAIFRSVLAGRCELAALEAALACVWPNSSGPRALQDLLAQTAELEADLTALRVLAAMTTPWSPAPAGKALEKTRDAALSRLDLRWRLWKPLLPVLVIGATSRQVRRLRDRIGRLLRQDGLQPEDRQALEEALTAVSELQRIQRLVRQGSKGMERDRPEEPTEKTRRTPRRHKPAAGDQLDIELF